MSTITTIPSLLQLLGQFVIMILFAMYHGLQCTEEVPACKGDSSGRCLIAFGKLSSNQDLAQGTTESPAC